jgi:hypothetical protein
MKTLLKNLVGGTAKSDGAWWAYRMCGRASQYLGKIYGHARFVRETFERDQNLTRIATELFPSLTVATGPFEGMRYPNLRSVGSALLPKLLGSYESELHPVLEQLLRQPYDAVVDVGCAEGYYAVGIGLRLGTAEIYAFDTDSRAREVCGEMAKLNGVAQRVHVGGLCDKAVLKSLPLGDRALIIADCEGYEKQLFDSEMAGVLARHDLIIETHDFIDISISKYIREVFARTHCIRSIRSVDDIQKAHTYDYPQLEKFTLSERRLILGERRPAIMEWFVMTPLARAGDGGRSGAL